MDRIQTDGIIWDIDGTLWDATGTVAPAWTEKLNSINFQGLNQSIEDLGKVVSPLSEFFSRFN